MMRKCFFVALSLAWVGWTTAPLVGGHLAELQRMAVENNRSPAAHWGPNPEKYSSWTTHSNRLIPVYTYGTLGAGKGIDLNDYINDNSAYRSADRLRQIYGYVPTETVTPAANYMDQTDVYRIQKAALQAGKKHIVLVVFDGMDWQTTWAAAISKAGKVGYHEGRGTGLFWQDYTANNTTQFADMVTSPHNEGTNIDVNNQRVTNPGGTLRGGFNIERGGANAWADTSDPQYWIGKSEDMAFRHAYTDSSSSASSMTAGIKTFNNGVNVDATGIPVPTIAHEAQAAGYAIGVVSSVPISHATPAAAYSHNVTRNDYQDLTRDLVGRPSIAHANPLSGVDVLIGGGWGVERDKDGAQGKNYEGGNRYLAPSDLKAIDIANGGKYVVVQREVGKKGPEQLAAAAEKAASEGHRLFGFYGATGSENFAGNLPLQGAAGDYKPGPGWRSRDLAYTEADVAENVTLAEMTDAALTVLAKNPKGFWLMVEAGDVDWANHDNNLDASVGAVLSGDEAIQRIAKWVEANGGWENAVMVVTADHAHYLVIDDPGQLVEKPSEQPKAEPQVSASPE